MKCSSCKNKNSDERCSSKPLRGLIFCGKHARVKSPRLWKDVNQLDSRIIPIQKLWRGYILRKWICLAGPGALNRNICHNDEELVTMDDKRSVSPLDYFAFTENDKVYWFDIRSIVEASIFSVTPTNPYTRQDLSIDTRQRMRRLCIIRQRRKMMNEHGEVKRNIGEVLKASWTYICQIIIENGFFDMSPLYFMSLNKTQLYIFITMIRNDMIALAAEHTSPESRRNKYVYWLKRLQDQHDSNVSVLELSYFTSKILSTILNDLAEPYPMCFIIMSAMHRL